jgi:hypothetical protein
MITCPITLRVITIWVFVYEQDATDFIDFVRFKLGIDDYDAVDAE